MAARLGVTVHAVAVAVDAVHMTTGAVDSIRDGIPCTDERS